MVTVDLVMQERHDADYVLHRETTRDSIYFTTYRPHASQDIALYCNNVMTGIVRDIETSKLRELIEEAEGGKE